MNIKQLTLEQAAQRGMKTPSLESFKTYLDAVLCKLL